MIGCRTLDQMVVSLIPCHLPTVVKLFTPHTNVPVLHSSINWYWRKLGGIQAQYVSHWPTVCGLAASAGVWMAMNGIVLY